MEALVVLVLLVQTLIQYPQMVGDGLDEATRLHMEMREKYLNQEMTRLLQELEQSSLEHSVRAWGALLWATLGQWHFWALVGVLGLLLALCFSLRKRSREPHSSAPQENASSNVEAQEDQVNGSANVEGSNAAGREARQDGANGDREQDPESKLVRFIEECIRWPVLDRGCMIRDLIDDLTRAFGCLLSSRFYPVPQQAIGMDSAFEGWSPCQEDLVYRVLVPLNPPPGHTFQLELITAAGMPAKKFCIRVEQVPIPEEELRRNEQLSLLYNLCTRSYLDVEKTTLWFRLLVRTSWLRLPQSNHWHLRLLPSSRSCKFRLTKGGESFRVEVLFGVQQGNSDIYVSSQSGEALFTPSTVWSETYAVAEMKFFSHIARQAPHDSCHLRCLQLLARTVVDTAFSSYTLKTIMMHLLNTIPMAQWCRRDCRQRLLDSLDYLRCCLQKKRLDSFVIGNQSIPLEIDLPPHFQTLQPANLFWHLAQDPDAHREAWQDFFFLRYRLKQLLVAIDGQASSAPGTPIG
ncbi:inositol 1,4,5-trisphosphate receptor-interacting protein-like 1 [Neopelma chrysocephalum]|uniref:inositol 1,4,5-trisphosphate receptor-interacting protein-like 1 n=1 Tax=Neopelma chrysocephalum TaxID=114329 RepID=UPI000FCCFAFC|nr:inositol 1,4,5-trisphosphate receptor-interacting protein-like 1 [Neopelma chrysocephalum]